VLEGAEWGGRWVLAEARNVRYGNMVRPGKRLTVEVQRLKLEGDRHTFQGRGTVEGDVAVQGRFVMRPIIQRPTGGAYRCP
jgi:3-hydroxyacyl-[acyl-carrier-protein] dehydratase